MSRPMHFQVLLVLGLATSVLAASCGQKAAEEAAVPVSSVSVAKVDLGRAVGEDNRITDETNDFKPNDVIYASVHTRGAAPNATLKVVWTFQDGQVVDQSERTIAPAGDAATEFHIAKADGWPVGNYRVEVFLNQISAEVHEFKVEAS
ncbi:MAG: hypothetical protein ABIS67_15340 [Candidatus Eisenbacteria bacterium]